MRSTKTDQEGRDSSTGAFGGQAAPSIAIPGVSCPAQRRDLLGTSDCRPLNVRSAMVITPTRTKIPMLCAAGMDD